MSCAPNFPTTNIVYLTNESATVYTCWHLASQKHSEHCGQDYLLSCSSHPQRQTSTWKFQQFHLVLHLYSHSNHLRFLWALKEGKEWTDDRILTQLIWKCSSDLWERKKWEERTGYRKTHFYQRQSRSYWLREQRDMSNYAPLGKLILLLHLNITSTAPVAVHGTTAFITGCRNFYINKTIKTLKNSMKSLLQMLKMCNYWFMLHRLSL